MTAGTTPEGIRPGTEYWASLDGIRGLTMVVIFAYHGYPPLVPGAGIAVDAFFVMSAFLITTLLVREHEASGRIDLRQFYRRRVFRLLPALLVVVPPAGALAWLVLPEERSEVLPSVASVFLYYANFRAASRPEEMSVFLPTWSLSTEEQFYVVWPSLLLVLLAVRAGPRALLALVGGLLVVSTIWLQWSYDSGTPISAVVLRPDLRLSGILVGTFAGLLYAYGLVDRRARPAVRAATVAGSAFVLLYLVHPQWLPERFVVTLAVVVACLAFALLVVQQVSWPWQPFTLVLGWRPLLWVGRASYVLYLLHVPVLRIVDELLGAPGPWVRVPVAAVITVALGGAVHQWVEKPALRHKERRRTVQPSAA